MCQTMQLRYYVTPCESVGLVNVVYGELILARFGVAMVSGRSFPVASRLFFLFFGL
jgi:hypothetical protein